MDGPSNPLADYFWIAGVESVSYNDAYTPKPAPQRNTTISEHGEPDEPAPSRATARHSRQNSANRLSKVTLDVRASIHTLDEVDGNTRSSRSSATIKAVPNGDARPASGEFD